MYCYNASKADGIVVGVVAINAPSSCAGVQRRICEPSHLLSNCVYDNSNGGYGCEANIELINCEVGQSTFVGPGAPVVGP